MDSRALAGRAGGDGVKARIVKFINDGWPVVFLLLHAVKMFAWFHRVEWHSALPIVNHDFIIYYARMLRFHEFVARSGRFWGYDPTNMAGCLSGPS